jgi:hypothetical protein
MPAESVRAAVPCPVRGFVLPGSWQQGQEGNTRRWDQVRFWLQNQARIQNQDRRQTRGVDWGIRLSPRQARMPD